MSRPSIAVDKRLSGRPQSRGEKREGGDKHLVVFLQRLWELQYNFERCRGGGREVWSHRKSGS